MRKYAFIVVALLAVGTFLGARAVGAQGDDFRTACTDPAFDVNQDGIVSNSDGRAWALLAGQCLDRENVPGFISAAACRAIIGDNAFDQADLNGDGELTHDDSIAMGDRTWQCWPSIRGPQPR